MYLLTEVVNTREDENIFSQAPRESKFCIVLPVQTVISCGISGLNVHQYTETGLSQYSTCLLYPHFHPMFAHVVETF